MSKLSDLRKELNITQDGLVHSNGEPPMVTLSTYRNAEQGKSVSYTTARNILALLNIVRAEYSKEPLKLEDLELDIV